MSIAIATLTVIPKYMTKMKIPIRTKKMFLRVSSKHFNKNSLMPITKVNKKSRISLANLM